LSGFPDEEIEIALDKSTLRKFDLSLSQIANALRTTNLDITGGTIKGTQEEMLIRSRNKQYDAKDLQNIVVFTRPSGQTIRLKDVGEVRNRWADSPSRAAFNGINSVEITVNNTDQEDLLSTCAFVNNYVKEYNASNDHMRLDVITDFSITLQQRKDLLFENGLLGFFLVLILLTLFLNLRLAFWVAIGIPVSFAGMFILATYFGITINVISLFGMIVVIGILVDDGIVIAENIYAHFERGKPLLRAALDGTVEVIPSVVSAVLTTIIAFSSFFFLDGRAGDFFSEMSFIVIATLAVSLIEGLLFLPTHLSHAKLERNAKMNPVQSAATKALFRFRDKIYAPFLRWSLHNKIITISFFFAIMFVTFGAIGGGIIRTQFFPFIERDNINISLDMPAGTNEAVTQKWIDHIESTVWAVNEQYKSEREDSLDVVRAIQKNIGPISSKARLNVILLDSETRLTPSYLIQNDIRKAAGEIEGADNVSFGGVQAFGKPISISLVSYDLVELKAAKEALKAKLKRMDALTDVIDNDQKGIREVTLELTDKARYLGLTPGAVMTQVRETFFGAQVQRLQRGEDEVKVWVRLDEKDRKQLWDLEELLITTPQGNVPLRELATYTIERGTVNINHLDGQREYRVESDLSSPNGSAPALLSQIKADILPEIFAKYPSVSARYEGQQKESQKTQDSSQTVMPLIFFLIILTITFTFRSLVQTIMIMLLIPLSLTGVAWGHWLHGMPMSILSFLGVVALIGIIVNDSLVLVSKYNINVKSGEKVYDAIFNAGISRFRAIFLTTVTTIAGLAPLIFETSFQAQFLIPMAVAIAYGIGFATMLTLVVLPSMMALVNDARVLMRHIWTNEKPTREEVEPAIKEMKSEQYFKELNNAE
jgi:multidrug efflux pump subunit AcrB